VGGALLKAEAVYRLSSAWTRRNVTVSWRITPASTRTTQKSSRESYFVIWFYSATRVSEKTFSQCEVALAMFRDISIEMDHEKKCKGERHWGNAPPVFRLW